MATIATMNVALTAGTGRFNRSMRGAGKRVGLFQKAVGGLSRALVGLAAGLTAMAAIRGATRAFADFEEQMLRVKALTSATASEFAKLNATARKLGETTSFTAGQVASAEKILAQAGFTVDEITSSLRGVLDMSEIGSIGLEDAATILTQALRGFDLPTGSAGAIVDVLTNAASTANTSVMQLGDALKFVTSAAKVAGVDIRDTVAALQVLANVSYQGERGGTALRQIFLKLANVSKGAQVELDRLGVTTADWLGNLRPLADIVDDFGGALGKMGSKEQLASLGKIFEGRTAAAFAALMTKGGDAIREFSESARNAEGSAKSFMDILEKALSKQFLALTSALSSVGIEMLAIAGPTIKTMILGLTRLLRIISALLKKFRPFLTALAKIVSFTTFFEKTNSAQNILGMLPEDLQKAALPDTSRPASKLPEVANQALNLGNVFDKVKGKAAALFDAMKKSGPARKLAELGKTITENWKKLGAQAKSVIEATRTPFERFLKTREELQKLFKVGLIDPETLRRGLAQSFGRIPDLQMRSPSAIRAGTASAVSAQRQSGRSAKALGKRVEKIDLNTASIEQLMREFTNDQVGNVVLRF